MNATKTRAERSIDRMWLCKLPEAARTFCLDYAHSFSIGDEIGNWRLDLAVLKNLFRFSAVYQLSLISQADSANCNYTQ